MKPRRARLLTPCILNRTTLAVDYPEGQSLRRISSLFSCHLSSPWTATSSAFQCAVTYQGALWVGCPRHPEVGWIIPHRFVLLFQSARRVWWSTHGGQAWSCHGEHQRSFWWKISLMYRPFGWSWWSQSLNNRGQGHNLCIAFQDLNSFLAAALWLHICSGKQ